MTDESHLPTQRTTAAYPGGTGLIAPPDPDPERSPHEERTTLLETEAPEPAVAVGPGSPPLLDDREKYLARVDHRATVGRMRRLVPAACLGWIAFFGLDALVALWVYPTNIVPFAVLRLAGLVVLVTAAVLLRRVQDPSPGLVLVLDVSMIVASSACLSLMSLYAGGVSSPYHALVVLVIVGRVAVIPHRWQDASWRLAIPALLDMLIVGVATLAVPAVRAQWLEPAARGSYVFHAALLIGSWFLVVLGSHQAWALRRQVFASRNLGRFKLRKRIGRGGMGEVWVARDEELRRDVALKVLRPTENDPEGVTRFEREIRATAALRHPNTVRIFNHGVSEDGLWYYAMELLDGESLQALVHRVGPLPPARATALIHQAARALSEAHEQGIVHRDIKPENLFVTTLAGEPDVTKVLDFGIARLVEDDSGLTSTGFVTGTPAYMAPEVAMGGSATPTSDVYGLGSALFFALTGRPPFEGPDAGSVMRQHVHAEAPRVGSRSPHRLPPALEEVVMRALEKDPAGRIQTASAFAEALRRSNDPAATPSLDTGSPPPP